MIKLVLSTFLLNALIANTALALPDDAKQEVLIDAAFFNGNGNAGIATYRGSEEEPVIIIQGSLKITSLEAIVERVNGAVHKVTATGKLAHFQQQPELDQAIIYGSGEKIVFDNTAQFLTMDIDAELIQDGTILNACHLDYDLSTEDMNGSPCNEGDRIHISMPASTE